MTTSDDNVIVSNRLSTTLTVALLSIVPMLTMLTMMITACSSGSSTNSNADSNANNNANNNGSGGQNIKLLNVSYDVSRDFYKEYNPLFIQQYQSEHPNSSVQIGQSHGGSSKQALSVANGLQADVVTMNQQTDIDVLVDKGLVDDDWQQQLPNNAIPYTSTIVFLVRTGNPKHIQDWDDLAKQGIQVVMPNPKTSGTARYAFLGAYGYGLHHFKANNNGHSEGSTASNADANQATNASNATDNTRDYMKRLLANVATYDNGSRAATTTFSQRGIGDVLITTENEAHQAVNGFAKGQVDIVYPSYSIQINNPVAQVKSVTDKKGTGAVAHDYLLKLWDKPAQQLMAQYYLRPSDPDILAQHSDTLPAIDTFEPTAVFGSWQQIMQRFFVEGGEFDKLATVQPVN
ncbi:sulfate ABC transporter substrate-binding protein [Psychrobacter sp. I-STPA6b]|uniref:sulfate ABC transporter substrate-binding protein n=1 Tax=Psychrobacter sp. I-STPA6b TaxID=2585718 RepID=UPI0039B61B21